MGCLPLLESGGDGDDDNSMGNSLVPKSVGGDDDNSMGNPLVPERGGDSDGDGDDDDNSMGNSLGPVGGDSDGDNSMSNSLGPVGGDSDGDTGGGCCVLGLDCTPDVIVAVGRIGDELKGPSRRN